MTELLEFERWLYADGKAVKTIESYVTDVKGYQRFLAERLKEEAVLSRFSFVRYCDQLMKENYAISTINIKINSVGR